jgi:hypothetical protein
VVAVEAYFERERCALFGARSPEWLVPRLLHLDLNQSNVFISEDRRSVSCIIDWDETSFGHAEEELMRTEVRAIIKVPLYMENPYRFWYYS